MCYDNSMASTTSSFRISDELRLRLDEAARRLNKGKNWIVKQALEEYLAHHSRTNLRDEARRQSLLASQKPWKAAQLWEKAGAETWRD